MTQLVFPRRLVSAPTTITVGVAPPAWLPAQGSWSTPSNPVNGAKPASLNTASSQMGNFPPRYPSGRFFESLWNDYSGAVWNPYYGTLGAMMFGAGGGHPEANWSMTDNGTWVWPADTRQWIRLCDPTYPGEIPEADYNTNNPPFASSLMQDWGEYATGVPAASHNRGLPCIVSPTWSGSAYGGYCTGGQSSIGRSGLWGVKKAHMLNVSLALQVGSNLASQAGGGWARVGTGEANIDRLRNGTVDNNRGHIYVTSGLDDRLAKLPISSPTWTFDREPSGYSASPMSDNDRCIEWAGSLDMLIQMDQNFNLGLMPCDDTVAPSLTIKTTVGVKPTVGYGSTSGDGAAYGFVWCPDITPFGAVVYWNSLTMSVHACRPSTNNPLTATWTWATLAASNTPNIYSGTDYLNNYLWYKRFQYAPALKSFVLCSMPNDIYGGIVIFRPLATDLP